MVSQFTIKTVKRKQAIVLTEKINSLLDKQEKEDGTCTVFLTHTTACLTTGEIGEGTDEDLFEVIEKIIPQISFRHAHDPSHAWTHMATSFIGTSLTIPFKNKRLILGTWQSVLLVELDGPRERTVVVSIY